jgi:quinoprotein glucose dehydrogenase
MKIFFNLILSAGFTCILFSCNPRPEFDHREWSDYLGGPDRNHFSKLDQITPQNVGQLKMAWRFSMPDSGQMQMNPIVYDGLLYGVSAGLQVVALNAATGELVWKHGESMKAWYSLSRGVAVWKGENEARVFYTTGHFLHALNAKTGEVIESFGDHGKLDLHTGLPEIAKNKFILSATPGTIYKNLIIMPTRLSEDFDAAPGDLRAFDVITGQLVWTFHNVPHPGEPGYETWENKDAWKNEEVGGANNWCGMTIDMRTGMLFVPTGSAAPDFYGGHRLGSNLYANCLLALDAETGKKIWHYQFVHHDIWDRDVPTPPNLITVVRDGKKIEAVSQLTKQGFVFVFERATGKPLFEIEEKPFPASAMEGERAWTTQPVPVKPAPVARMAYQLTEQDISPYAENKEELLALFKAADRRLFAPPSTDPVFLLPGYDGGAEWGGTGASPDEGIIYVNSNEMAWILQLEKTGSAELQSPGQILYDSRCSACHQDDLKGIPASGYPSLVDVTKRKSVDEILNLVAAGKGRMPGFPQLTKAEKDDLIGFLEGKEQPKTQLAEKPLLPYRHTGYNKFLDSNGLPGISPPWGTLNAIDLNTGEYLWKIPYGETPALREKGFPTTGSENYGGPVVTENGLIFIAGTKDELISAYNRHTGEKLWEAKLPAAAFATPATYMINGKQYVAVACGGEKLGAKKGNEIVAFALE